MVSDKKIGTNLEKGNYHQEDTLTLLKCFLTPDSVVLDIGAHIGTLAIPLARLAGKVIAFEPAPATFELLKRNIEQNSLAIDARNIGLGPEPGHASLEIENAANAGAHTLSIGSGTIKVSTLDDEVEYADVIKIDVEGMELSVFEGGADLIEQHHPVIYSEINLSALRAHGSSVQKIEQFLYKRGYDLYIPLEDVSGAMIIGKIGSLGALTACIAPRAWLLRSESAPFDIVAIPRGKELPLPVISVSQTMLKIISNNLKQKVIRIKNHFVSAAHSIPKIRKAVTFRASSIGDSLMGKYLLENIRAQYPGAKCTILVAGKAEMIRDLLAAYPWITVEEANKTRPRSIFRAFKRLFPSDASVTQYSGRGQFATATKLFARLITKPGRLAGFTDTWPFNRFVFDHLIPFSMRRAMRLHECDALQALGVEPTITHITLKALEGNGVLSRLDLEEGGYIVANLFSGTPRRGLSLPHQIDIVSALADQFGIHKKIILTGGPLDTPIVDNIKEAVPGAVAAPGLTMQELITLCVKSAGVVSLDTGVGHISAQVGVPLVILRTCWGYNWWNKDNYPRNGIEVLTREDLCEHGHILKDFPDCLGKVSTTDILVSAKKLFI